MEPAAQLALGLVAQPQPGELDRQRAGAPVARFADALIAMAVPTVVGGIGQPDKTADLAAIVERAVKHLVHQLAPADHADAPEIDQMIDLLLDRPTRWRSHFGSALGLERDEVLLHQA